MPPIAGGAKRISTRKRITKFEDKVEHKITQLSLEQLKRDNVTA